VRAVGVKPYRHIVIRDGAVEIAPCVVRDAPFVVGGGGPGLKPDRLVVVGDGAVEVALGGVRGATVVEGSGVIRVEKLWGGRRRSWHLHRPYELMEVAPWPKSMISAEA